jgi:polyisoprenoid-binding protein YceI
MTPLRLHVGCGDQRLEGWVNIDRQQLPAVDLVADVSEGLPFSGAEALFAEHFLEHLPLDAAIGFLLEAHRVLAPGGFLRLSTPNLAWVLVTQAPGAPAERAAMQTLRLNRAFHGWSHRFLWTDHLLGEALAACGFEEITWCRHGESPRPFLRGLERHATFDDTAELPHVLVVEARRGSPQPERLAALLRLAEEEFLRDTRPDAWRIDATRSAVVVRWPLLAPLAGPLRGIAGVAQVSLGWVGGSVMVRPEAPHASRLDLEIDLRHLTLSTRRRVPRRLRLRLERELRGPRGLDVEHQAILRVVSSALTREPGGAMTLEGAIRLGETSLPVTVRAAVSQGAEQWRARGELEVSARALGVPSWGALGLRGGDALGVAFDLVAVPHAPT